MSSVRFVQLKVQGEGVTTGTSFDWTLLIITNYHNTSVGNIKVRMQLVKLTVKRG